jgi:uncharacterized protein
MTKKHPKHHEPSIFNRAAHWCEKQIFRFPWTLLIVSLLLTIATSYYVYNNLSVNTNTAEMLSPDLPFQKNQRRIDEAFPQDAAATLLVVESDTPEQTSQAAFKLTELLSQEKQYFDSAYIPEDNEFFRRYALLYLDQADLEDLAKKLTDAQPFIGHLAQNYSLTGLLEIITLALEQHDQHLPMDLNPLLTAIGDNLTPSLNGQAHALSWQSLLADNKLNAEAKQMVVIAKPKLKFDEMLPAELAQNAAHTAAKSVMQDYPSVRIRITGEPALEHEELESVSTGAQLAGVLSLILVFVVQWVGLRSLKLLTITYIVLTVGLIFTAGFAGISVGHLNVISIAFASLYIGLGVDYAVHLCLYYRERRVRGYSNHDAIHHSMSGVGSSLFLCALTTALGFLAFIPTDYSGVSELGIISGGGIFIGLVISLTILPALFCVMPVNNPKPIKSAFAPQWIVTFPFHYANTIRIVSVLLAIGSIWVLTELTFDSNPINLRDPHSESVSTFNDLLKSKNDSPFAITALANSLDEANALAKKMRQLPSVHDTISLSSFVAENQADKLVVLDDLNLMLGNQLKNFNTVLKENDQKAALTKFNETLKKAIAENSPNAPLASLQTLQQQVEAFLKQADSSANAAATYSLLEKNILGLLPYTMERLRTSLTAGEFTLDDIPADIKSHWLSANGLYRILITPEKDLNNPDNLKEFVQQAQSVNDAVAGFPITNLAGGEAVVKAFVQAFASAFTVITLILWATYRNFKHMLLVIGPLLLAALLTGATNVLLNNPFNFANVIALPLLLGMGIDSSILIMHRLHFNVHEDENLLHSSTTRGIIFSSITTLCSFSSLSFTSHQGMASMGLLLSIGLFFTVICSLIVLPAFSGKRV